MQLVKLGSSTLLAAIALIHPDVNHVRRFLHQATRLRYRLRPHHLASRTD